MNKKTLSGFGVGIVAIIAVALMASSSLTQISANTQVQHFLDFNAKVPLQIDIKKGGTVQIPVDIYGSSKSRIVDVVVTKADPTHGGAINEDTSNPKLPSGFSIDLPIKNIKMQALDEKAHEKPLTSTTMTISVDNTVSPGVYPFAIHMIDNNPLGSDGSQISYFYINVE